MFDGTDGLIFLRVKNSEDCSKLIIQGGGWGAGGGNKQLPDTVRRVTR